MCENSSIIDLIEVLSDFLRNTANDRYDIWEITDDHIILTDKFDASDLEIRVEESD